MLSVYQIFIRTVLLTYCHGRNADRTGPIILNDKYQRMCYHKFWVHFRWKDKAFLNNINVFFAVFRPNKEFFYFLFSSF